MTLFSEVEASARRRAALEIADLILAQSKYEGEQAQRVIKMCAHVALSYAGGAKQR